MPHGLPDWGLEGPKSTTYGLDDLGEQAVRLGSIVSFDRRGDVVLLDDYTQGLTRPQYALNGLGAAYRLVNDRSRWGPLAVRLVGGSTLTRHCVMSYTLGYPVLGSFGVEVGLQFLTELDEVDITLSIFTGARHVEGLLRYERSVPEWEYMDNLGAYVAFLSPWQINLLNPPFNTVKLVVDAVNEEYVRAIVDNVSYPMPGVPAWWGVNATSPRLLIEVWMVSRALQNDYVQIDGVIVTQNEP